MAVTIPRRVHPGAIAPGLPPIPQTLAQGAPPPPLPPATPAPFDYTAPTPDRFTGTAPTPTPYGDFTAPDPAKVAEDPYYQFRLAQGLKQQQRGAAARGTLLSGGFQKALLGYGQGLASEEAGNAYQRALSTYGANRDTNAQNFGQRMGAFQGNLGAFTANAGADLGRGRLGLDAATAQYDRAYGAARDDRDYQQALRDYAVQGEMAAQDFARRANEESRAFTEANRPKAPVDPWPWRDRVPARRPRG